jgi:ammonium transporter Rh
MNNRELEETKANVSEMNEKLTEYKNWVFIFLFGEALVILFYGLFTQYDSESNATDALKQDSLSNNTVLTYYPIFQDIHVMMFIGFGFLYVYLRTYSWSSVAINYFLGAWCLQISILLLGFWTAVFSNKWEKVLLNIVWLIKADFAVAAVLISFGGVLGKFNVAQYMIMGTIELIFYSLNNIVGEQVFHAVDMGGSMYIHTFGAYFGIAVAYMTSSNEAHNHPNNSSNYNSNLIAMIGTIFLWMFWPSFNCALALGNARHRTIFNTVMSMTGSCIVVFIFGPIFKRGKFHMEAILNATVAGGVVIGASSDIILSSWASILIGFGGGFISLLGFEVIGPYLASKTGLHDTAGIHNLHGITGFTGGIIGAICAGTVTTSAFGDSINIIYPKMKERSPSIQAGYQLAALGLTLGISIISGIFTGLILRSECLQGPTLLFSDRPFWELDGINLPDGEVEDRKELVSTNNKDNEKHNDRKEIPTERIDLKEIEMI